MLSKYYHIGQITGCPAAGDRGDPSAQVMKPRTRYRRRTKPATPAPSMRRQFEKSIDTAGLARAAADATLKGLDMATISVVITTHKRPHFLRRAIQSIKTQTKPDIQVIVVSDIVCSETHQVASTLLSNDDLFLQRSGQPGPAASRNLGMSLATGDYLAFLDDDDAFTEEFFAAIEPQLRDDDIVYTNYHVVFERSENGAFSPYHAEHRSLVNNKLDDIYVKNFIPLHCLVYPRSRVAMHQFDTSLVLNEDWDFILNVLQKTSLRHIESNGPVIYSRQTADNRGRRNDHLLEDTYRRIYRAWPAPTHAIKLARQSFLGAHGIAVSLDEI